MRNKNRSTSFFALIDQIPRGHPGQFSGAAQATSVGISYTQSDTTAPTASPTQSPAALAAGWN